MRFVKDEATAENEKITASTLQSTGVGMIEFGIESQDDASAPNLDASGLDPLVDARISSSQVEGLKRRG